VVNSADDMVCLPTQVQDQLVLTHGTYALLCTQYGSHCAFNEGWSSLGSYIQRVTFTWLDAAHQAAQEVGEG